jgi:hypothetical protein
MVKAMPSSIVVRRDGNSWVIELEIHNGKDKVVLGKDPSLRMALRQALYTVTDIISTFISYGQYYCSNAWKDLLKESNKVVDSRIVTFAKIDVNDFLGVCENEPVYMVENVE